MFLRYTLRLFFSTHFHAKRQPIDIILIFYITKLKWYIYLHRSLMDAYLLWLMFVICEVWLALSWLLDQLPKWYPVNQETFLEKLALRLVKSFNIQLYGWKSEIWSRPNFSRLCSQIWQKGEPSQLALIDVIVITPDPMDYPVKKVSCYISDDGAAMLTFDAIFATTKFAKEWVPFCKKNHIEPRAPEFYF